MFYPVKFSEDVKYSAGCGLTDQSRDFFIRTMNPSNLEYEPFFPNMKGK